MGTYKYDMVVFAPLNWNFIQLLALQENNALSVVIIERTRKIERYSNMERSECFHVIYCFSVIFITWFAGSFNIVSDLIKTLWLLIMDGVQLPQGFKNKCIWVGAYSFFFLLFIVLPQYYKTAIHAFCLTSSF